MGGCEGSARRWVGVRVVLGDGWWDENGRMHNIVPHPHRTVVGVSLETLNHPTV